MSTTLRRWLAGATTILMAMTAGPHARMAAQSGGAARTAAPAQRGAVERNRVDGRVRRPVGPRGDSTGMGPAAGIWVTLHRVGKDTAGPIDSVRTDANGRYAMAYARTGMADAVYFASVTWHGIAYFTAPLKSAVARGDEAEITVFDTTSTAFPLAVKGRHFIVGKADSTGARTVIEVFELSNDSLRTLVSPPGEVPTPTWSVAVPEAAQDVRVTQGEISADAFVAQKGRVSVYAPIAPGLKQVAFSYTLKSGSFPLQVRADHGAVVFEVLLEEPKGAVFGAGVAAVDPVTLENRNFRRFLAQDVKDGVLLTVEMPEALTSGRNLYIAGLLVAIGCLMLLVLTRAMNRRSAAGRREAAAQATAAPTADRLAREIALLDATYAQQTAPTPEVSAAYEARRAELKAALADALAASTVRS